MHLGSIDAAASGIEPNKAERVQAQIGVELRIFARAREEAIDSLAALAGGGRS
jgi:hypothetical protein